MPQDAAAIRSILSLAPVVPVIILDDVSQARPLAEALVAGGLPILEGCRSARALGTCRMPIKPNHHIEMSANRP